MTDVPDAVGAHLGITDARSPDTSSLDGLPACASLPMYPFVPLRPAWSSLWHEVRQRLRDPAAVPVALSWDDDVHALWSDPRCVLSQTCAWPLVTRYSDRLTAIGAFDPAIPGAGAGRYRSVLVARSSAWPRPSALAGGRAAVNATDSLSGWVSLTLAVHRTVGRWDGAVVETGGHAASIDAVRAGRADIASIDAVTWALLHDLEPQRVRDLAVVGRGPLVPCLPVVVPRTTSPAQVHDLTRAFVDACTSGTTAAARRRLRIRRFVPWPGDELTELRRLVTSPPAE